MIGLGLLLAALGAGDLAAGGLAGEPTDRRAVSRGSIVAGIVTVVGGPATGMTAWSVVALTITALAGFGIWGWLRTEPGSTHALWALVALAATIGAGVVASARWTAADGGLLADWLSDAPYDFAGAGPGRLMLVAGTVAALGATANGAVRATLRAAGTEIDRPSTVLRGGRVIGALERILVFGLAAAGQLAAAAIVASAKGILRFPELTKLPQPPRLAEADDLPVVGQADYVTEYFLLGSLASWSLALAPVMLL